MNFFRKPVDTWRVVDHVRFEAIPCVFEAQFESERQPHADDVFFEAVNLNDVAADPVFLSFGKACELGSFRSYLNSHLVPTIGRSENFYTVSFEYCGSVDYCSVGQKVAPECDVNNNDTEKSETPSQNPPTHTQQPASPSAPSRKRRGSWSWPETPKMWSKRAKLVVLGPDGQQQSTDEKEKTEKPAHVPKCSIM